MGSRDWCARGRELIRAGIELRVEFGSFAGMANPVVRETRDRPSLAVSGRFVSERASFATAECDFRPRPRQPRRVITRPGINPACTRVLMQRQRGGGIANSSRFMHALNNAADTRRVLARLIYIYACSRRRRRRRRRPCLAYIAFVTNSPCRGNATQRVYV